MSTEMFYPDVVEAGGCNLLLKELLHNMHPDFRVRLEWPFLPDEQRFLFIGKKSFYISMALKERLFIVDYTNNGHFLANGGSDDISLIAASVHYWFTHEISVTEFCRLYPFIEPLERAHAVETNTLHEFKWNSVLSRLSGPALAIAEMARKHPVLGQFYPFSSHSRLGFYRDEYIYWSSGFLVRSVTAEEYEICSESYDAEVVFTGNAEDVLTYYTSLLPDEWF